MTRPRFIDLFYDHVGPSMARHLALLDAVEGLPCDLDLKRGQARFNDRYLFAIQLLGIEDQHAGVWTWSWALPPTAVAAVVARMARSLETWGKEQGHEPFHVARFNTGKISGDHIAIVARGITNSDTFLVAETSMGTAFLLIPDVAGQIPLQQRAAFIAKVIPEVLTTYPLDDHGRVVRSLLQFEGFALESAGSTWNASRNDGSRVTIRFDEHDRVAKIEVHDKR